MADPDEALIEAIAEAILTAYLPVRERFTPWKAASAVSDEQRQTARTYARAAYAAMVKELGLVEQEVPSVDGRSIVARRLATRWVEVDHGSE